MDNSGALALIASAGTIAAGVIAAAHVVRQAVDRLAAIILPLVPKSVSPVIARVESAVDVADNAAETLGKVLGK